MHTAPALRLIPQETPSATLVAYSGGLDSSVLLHLLASQTDIRHRGLRAVHVHHGLHPDADAWAEHCAAVCTGLGIPLEVVRVTVERDSGHGPEAAARQARRQAFAQVLRTDESLALAQHRDDQAETFLLRALRASGPDGLASMRAWQSFAAGWMWRPLLETPHASLHSIARQQALSWIDDPSNADISLDRNYLRHRVLPLLRERWPHADAAFARAATLAAESSGILHDEDVQALATVREETGEALSVPALRALSVARRARVLRYWVSTLGQSTPCTAMSKPTSTMLSSIDTSGWPPLPAEGVARIEADLLGPRSDGRACFAWQGYEIRRWRDGLYALAYAHGLPAEWSTAWDGRTRLDLPTGDTLRLLGVDAFPSPLRLHARRGGERILLANRGHHHTLKHVLQELDIPPWDRWRMPLLSTEDGILLAAGDSVRSAGFDHWLQSQGAYLMWDRPALHRQ